MTLLAGLAKCFMLSWMIGRSTAFAFQSVSCPARLGTGVPAWPSRSSLTPRSSGILFAASTKDTLSTRQSFSRDIQSLYRPIPQAVSPLYEGRETTRTPRRYQQSMLFSSSSSGPEEEDDSNKDLVNKLMDFVSNFIRKYLWNPLRRLVKLVSKFLAGREKEEDESTDDSKTTDVSKTLQQDFEDKLVMISDDDFTEGDDVVESTRMASTITSKEDAAPETQEETEAATVATTTAVAEKPSNTTDSLPSFDISFTRSAVSAANVDLSGNWSMIISESFKKDYDEYLKKLGQPLIVRTVAMGIVGMTTEETIQTNRGRELSIRGRNARGMWDRTLLTSQGAAKEDYIPLVTDIVTADAETVSSEAWWEDGGRVHKSWLRGGTKYGGGDFESKRYLENDDKVLVCESIFHPNDKTREKAQVTWKFLRDGAEL